MGFFAVEEAPPLPTKDILSWIFDEPTYDVNKPVFVDAADTSRTLSHAQARTLIRRNIAGLRAIGAVPGDCILIHSFNDIYYPILVLSIIGAGCIFAGTNPGYTPLELKHHVGITKAKFLISEPELLDNLLAAAKDKGIPNSRVLIFDTQPTQTVPVGFESWKSLAIYGESDWVRFNDRHTCETTTAARLTSSGTTGLPKATVSTHMNFIAQHELLLGLGAEPRPYEVRSVMPLPFFHAAIGPRVHTSVLKAGETAFVMRRFDLEGFLRNMERFAATEIVLVSAMAVAIVMSPLIKKYSLRSVRYGAAGAAPIDKGVQARVLELLGEGAPFTQVYGMTESTCVATRFSYPENDVTGSVGRVMAGLEVKLVDDSGKDISGYDVTGEFCIRGPTIIPGYFENPEANKETFDADGFYHSGDIMYCDSKTKLWYVVDRKKELIKVRAFQVAPPEIEGLLLAHPDIVDAAVIGIKAQSEIDGEVPRAYVVRKPGVSEDQLSEQIVKDYVAQRLARYKRLEGGVRFVESIPKNASGKILKRILRDEAKKEGARL